MIKYMCNKCWGFFGSNEMNFDTEYDCDLCDECNPTEENK